jgi:hypothetical protein
MDMFCSGRIMSKQIRQALLATVLTVGWAAGANAGDAASRMINTPIGPVHTEFGLPAGAATVAQLYEAMDYQRASQAYLWALPLVSFAEWQNAARTVFGATDTDMVIYQSVRDKMGILTANGTTPYIGGFPNLEKTGPLIIDYPKGATAGGIGDFWQRPLTDMGETGPDRGKGGRYLILGPGQKVASEAGFHVVRSPTNTIFVAFRILDPNPSNAKSLLSHFRMYPLSDEKNPPATRFLTPEGRPWSQMPPHGMGYWARLSAAINAEPVQERDRMMMAMLRPLGIEKGRVFAPTSDQAKALDQGAQLGELMAQALSFRSRLPGTLYRPDSHWEVILNFDPTQESKFFTQLDERTNWFYQAVTATKGMATKVPGVGQAYLGASQDKDGQWLDGSKTYHLHVPPNPPAKLFWSVTLYDTLTRVFIDTPKDIVDRSSRMPLQKNADGSVDITMAPTAPAGGEQNWIPTLPGRAWFAYLRLYGPLEPYFNRTWALPDIEKVAGQ